MLASSCTVVNVKPLLTKRTSCLLGTAPNYLCESVLRLLGSMALSNHYRSEDLLDVDTAAGGFQQRQGLKYCLPLTFCIHTGLSQYIAVEAAEGRNKNEVFYQCPVSRTRV